MMYHPIKIWLHTDQQFSRYGRNNHIWLNEPSLWSWTWGQQTKFLAWHFSPWCSITIPSLVTEGQQLRRYCPDEHSLECWTSSVTLTFTTRAIQSFHKTIHLMMMCHQTKFSCKRISSSDNILKKAYFDYIILNCAFDLDDSKPIFLKDNLAHNDASPYQVWQ